MEDKFENKNLNYPKHRPGFVAVAMEERLCFNIAVCGKRNYKIMSLCIPRKKKGYFCVEWSSTHELDRDI